MARGFIYDQAGQNIATIADDGTVMAGSPPRVIAKVDSGNVNDLTGKFVCSLRELNSTQALEIAPAFEKLLNGTAEGPLWSASGFQSQVGEPRRGPK